MFRFSLIVGVSLIICVTAKPYKPWNQFTDETFQHSVMSVDKDGKMSWGVEVEPPENMDETDFDVDPNMKIWKSMTGGGEVKLHLKAEEDLDELYHPSMADLLRVQIQNVDALPADIPAHSMQVEEDKEDVQHPDFEVLPVEPEQDWDAVYYKAREELAGYLAPLTAEYKAGAEVPALYSEPEEDMDDLYHKDFLQPVPYQDDAPAAALVDLPFQGKHSEPEEDLDDIYHR
ncbi:uncharacterized protein si:ch211-217g15.3 [Labrus bergylta]|uniref:uncharacterized protein si:ch211-217g15.3 n=1 Tax=Labrus bergylta TaxID=56723 RepID=UPI0009B2E85A|nr:uncharacterized protein LOC109990733 [Labrus bergylta]